MAKVATLALVLLTACGDALVDAGYRGESSLTIQGAVGWAGTGSPPDQVQFRAALFYAPTLGSVDPEQWVEDVDSTTAVGVIPAPLNMNLFSLPTKAMQVGGYAVALARLLVYRDDNGDGRRQKSEPFVGLHQPEVWVYAPRDLTADQSPTGNALAAGMHAMDVPQRCPGSPSPPTTPGNCGVPLGARCNGDVDCGTGGLCLKETKVPWPAGYCVVPENPGKPGCRPGAGVLYLRPLYSPSPTTAAGFWLRACSNDSDCVREADPDQGQYACEPGLRACVPGPLGFANTPVGVTRFEIEPFCPQPLLPRP